MSKGSRGLPYRTAATPGHILVHAVLVHLSSPLVAPSTVELQCSMMTCTTCHQKASACHAAQTQLPPPLVVTKIHCKIVSSPTQTPKSAHTFHVLRNGRA